MEKKIWYVGEADIYNKIRVFLFKCKKHSYDEDFKKVHREIEETEEDVFYKRFSEAYSRRIDAYALCDEISIAIRRRTAAIAAILESKSEETLIQVLGVSGDTVRIHYDCEQQSLYSALDDIAWLLSEENIEDFQFEINRFYGRESDKIVDKISLDWNGFNVVFNRRDGNVDKMLQKYYDATDGVD